MRNKDFKKTSITFEELVELFVTTVKEYCPGWPNITTFTTDNGIKCVEIAPHSSDDENSPIVLRYDPHTNNFNVTAKYAIINIHGNITDLTDTELDCCAVVIMSKGLDVSTIIHVYDAITKYMMFGDFKHHGITLTRDDLIVPKYSYTFNTDIIRPGNAYQIIYKDLVNGDESVHNVICTKIDETETSIDCKMPFVSSMSIMTEEVISGKVTFTKSIDDGNITNDDVLVRHDTREASFNTDILEYGAVYDVTHNDDEFTAILTRTSNHMLQFMIASTSRDNFYMEIDYLVEDPDRVFTLRKLE